MKRWGAQSLTLWSLRRQREIRSPLQCGGEVFFGEGKTSVGNIRNSLPSVTVSSAAHCSKTRQPLGEGRSSYGYKGANNSKQWRNSLQLPPRLLIVLFPSFSF